MKINHHSKVSFHKKAQKSNNLPYIFLARNHNTKKKFIRVKFPLNNAEVFPTTEHHST